MFVAWVRAIDEDEQASAAQVGPLGLRLPHTTQEAPRGVRVVRVRRARAVALLGALTLTVSGGGVAAAINGGEMPSVRKLVEKVAPVQIAATPTPSDTAARMRWQVTAEQAKAAARSGQVDRARGMLDVMRKHSQADATLAGDVAEIEQEILAADRPNSSSQALGIAPVTLASLPTATTVPPQRGTIPPAPEPTAVRNPSGTSATGLPGTSAPASSATVPAATLPGTTTDPAPVNPTADSGSTSTPASASPAPSTIGSASGNQSAGVESSSPVPETSAPSHAHSEPAAAPKPPVSADSTPSESKAPVAQASKTQAPAKVPAAKVSTAAKASTTAKATTTKKAKASAGVTTSVTKSAAGSSTPAP